MTITHISKRRSLSISLLVGVAVSFPISSNAATFTIPTTTVNALTADGTSGPSFTVVGDFLGTDTISLTVSGTVNLADDGLGGGYFTNAAGITTVPSTQGIPGPAGAVNTFGAVKYGELLIGNNTLGFQQLFPTNATNGFGSSTPPTTLTLNNVSLASIGFTSGLSNGTVLSFQVGDTDYTNNSDGFTVGGFLNNSTTAVPEPFTVIGTLIGGTAALRMRKKLRADKPEN